MPLFTTAIFNIMLEVLARSSQARERNKRHINWKGEENYLQIVITSLYM